MSGTRTQIIRAEGIHLDYLNTITALEVTLFPKNYSRSKCESSFPRPVLPPGVNFMRENSEYVSSNLERNLLSVEKNIEKSFINKSERYRQVELSLEFLPQEIDPWKLVKELLSRTRDTNPTDCAIKSRNFIPKATQPYCVMPLT